MPTPKNKPNESVKDDSKGKSNLVQKSTPQDLKKDPEYSAMLEHFQQAEFSESQKLLEKLEEKYTGNADLTKFKQDLEIKISMEQYTISQRNREKRQKKKAARKLSLFAVAAILIVSLVFLASFFLLNRSMTARRLAEEEAVLNSLQTQAVQLLQSGRPQPAAEIIDRMREINPDYIGLNELETQTKILSNLEEKYDSAIALINENQTRDAYSILLEIEQEMPGLWDVSQRISLLETSFKVDELIDEGDKAFQSRDWDKVIESYENALVLNPDLNDSRIKERLLQSYFSEIARILETEQPTKEDIEKAEEYQQKAVSMAPQSDSFVFEQENLQKATQNLQVLKFRQSAKEILADKNQTLTSLADAVSYLREAVKLQGDDPDLQDELDRASTYRVAFRDFVNLDWQAAITNLQFLTGVDPNYADGNAATLQYEAYIALGKRYDSLGLFLDGLSGFQQAEILAFEDLNNLMKLFQVQILLGNTYGKIKDFDGAISYYQYALKAIKITDRLPESSPLIDQLNEADELAANQNYEEAFNAYQSFLDEIDVIFSTSEEVMREGTCLALFASAYQSTVDSIVSTNNLPATMVYTFRQSLIVPTIEN